MSKFYLGIMSGTSMDAIDVAAVTFDNSQPSLHNTNSVPLPTGYKEQYLRIINAGNCNLNELGMLDHWTGELFADAAIALLNKHNIDKKDVVAIGSHGQTLWHAPNAAKPFTMQIGDPNIIAEKTGITTVADFRRADVAAGGQGAPFAPGFHRAVFAKAGTPRCIVNIGGFSNISILQDDRYKGFDPGPGNCLMDYWVKTHFNLEFDADGALALQGKVNAQLLACCLDDPYFKRPAPKSAGREYFNPAWLQDKINAAQQNNLSPHDVLATLLHLTAQSITDAIKTYAVPNTQLYLCGGGAKNSALLNLLSKNFEQQVLTTSALGIDPMWVEAALFAWLAYETMNSHAIDFSTITGSKHPVLLGGIYGGATPTLL